MNGKNLPVAHGAPLRLRVERQLGYKHAKYLMRIQVVSAFDTLWGAEAVTGKIAAMSGMQVFIRELSLLIDLKKEI